MPKKEEKNHKQQRPDQHHPKKVFDVTRPGKSTAEPNSRSVIVGHKPPVADDQFVPTAPTLRAADPSEEHDLMDAKKKKDVLPVSFSEHQEISGAPDLPTSNSPKAEGIEKDVPAVTVATATVGDMLDAAPPAEAAAQIADTDTQTSLSEELPTPAPLASAASTKTEAPTDRPAPKDIWEADDDSNPAHLALDQTVESNAHATSDASVCADANGNPVFTDETTIPQSTSDKPQKSIEDLLAESGAPLLDSDSGPGLIISHHKPHHTSMWSSILVFLATLILIALIFDVLLDTEVLKPGLNIPHTNFFK